MIEGFTVLNVSTSIVSTSILCSTTVITNSGSIVPQLDFMATRSRLFSFPLSQGENDAR